MGRPVRGREHALRVRGSLSTGGNLDRVGRSSIRWVRSRTSLDRISGTSRSRSSRPNLAKPDLCSTATYGIARRWPAAEPVVRIRRRFAGPVALSSATHSPRDNHVRSAAAVRKPGGETYTNPLSGLPVKSIGLYVSPAHDGIEFVVGDSHDQIVSNDAAAHPTQVQECETTEHLAFCDVAPSAKCLANASRELRANATLGIAITSRPPLISRHVAPIAASSKPPRCCLAFATLVVSAGTSSAVSTSRLPLRRFGRLARSFVKWTRRDGRLEVHRINRPCPRRSRWPTVWPGHSTRSVTDRRRTTRPSVRRPLAAASRHALRGPHARLWRCDRQ